MISRSFERPDRTVSRASDARNRYKIRYTRTQHRPTSRQVNDHGRVSGTHTFYWPAYQRHLMDKPGWNAESVADLSSATTDILQRLSDPARPEAYQSKGLVVGYVQSGKTANITGVLAKAIDAGYRLLIVMTGTIDLLREQTQRRIDMELVGVENILRGIDPNDPETMTSVDYQNDPDWDRFISHGLLPSSQKPSRHYQAHKPSIRR